MTLQKDLDIAHATCPCVLPPWSVTKCRNCATGQEHHLDHCEWRGHAAIDRVVHMTRLDAMELIKEHADKDPAISAEIRKVLQRTS